MALILALLALLLLTAVGLTLATSTSTEVQVAANYRWSYQALYNAEAGLEVAKNSLVTSWGVGTTTGVGWLSPAARTTGFWDPATKTPPIPPPVARLSQSDRNYEMGQCDRLGNGMGYGVLAPGLSNISTFGGQTLNGAFTVWYRKPLVYNSNGTVQDWGTPADLNAYTTDVMVVVSEGVAPSAVTSAFTAGTRAVQVVEATIYGPPTTGNCEADLSGQAGGGAGGAGVDPCQVAAKSFVGGSIGAKVAGSQTTTYTRVTH